MDKSPVVNTTAHFPLVILVGVIVLCACAPLPNTPTSTGQVVGATSTPAQKPPPTSEAFETPNAGTTCPPMDSDLRTTMAKLEEQTIRLRGLQPTRSVQRGLLTPEQLRERVTQDFLADYSEEDARRDALVLALLGLIEPGLDLHGLYTDLLSEQIAGFYDSEQEEMIVVCGTGFSGLEVFTYVHEFVHALQDQAYDLEGGLNFSDEACDLDGERCFALRALIEGDASLLQEQWLRTFADEQIFESLLVSLGDLETPIFDSAPAYIQAELTFPYLAGLKFTRSIYLEDHWAGVDAAFQNPPVSSEQILHPERYPRDLPVTLTPPSTTDSLEPPWEIIDHDILGEWALKQVLLTQLSDDAAEQAASGWGGDMLTLFENAENGRHALVLVTQWDTMRDAHEFAGAFFNYGTARFGEPAHRDTTEATWVFDGGTSHFLRQSNQTRWIVASEGETLSMLQALVPLTLAAQQ